ncbi:MULTISPECIES: hypothetical protein [Cyanophyceae]|uniref:Glycosyl transferase family 1 domain-containing protein n=1 Tax=Nodularia spumigena CENA596 TaxID=1819295 RepID=A0A166IWV5_NODSP|nr:MULTISPECIES: hypothetical protein [Cyanophyceae]MDB9357229.1 hypothetical protein [Nodularia spumigena CS-587/03]KZL48956.1 hypothetical protein A2T98_15280 [Nodularia spumigena CENA596]MDB9318089.1 hypothetical protein [Nodularia spumigena CS-590/01A]MDB9323335.1 hypothetical protein [Nodularia spumigena CS-591/07A]MDB9326861.1 hypothetical protein [Nodularia spumigena CS-590/02]
MQKNNRQITLFRDTHFLSLSEGHGGNRRTLQIKEILSRANYEVIDLRDNPKLIQEFLEQSFFKIIIQLIKIIPYFFRYFAFIFPDYKKFISSVIKTWQLREKLTYNTYDKSKEKILICEDSLNFLTPRFAKKQGFKIISLPHNFDSISSNDCNFSNLSSNFRSLKNEIMHFHCSDHIFCISREEQWFLRLCGLKSDYLPYYPPESIVKNILEIRNDRACINFDDSSRSKQFVILGTYLNLPTKHGIIELVEWFNSFDKLINIKVYIAGFGTEKLKDEISLHSNLELLGTLSDQELTNVLIQTSAVIINQRYGLGALTKIPELLIAGVPVVVNGIAARSYHNYDGIYVYENKQELCDLLLSNKLYTPSILERPLQDETRFINTLNALCEMG